jgi:hypothetical protein
MREKCEKYEIRKMPQEVAQKTLEYELNFFVTTVLSDFPQT